MGKQTGLGANFYVNGFDISGDTNDLNNIRGGPKTGDATDITQFAHARFGLQRDGEVNFKVFFNPVAGAEHAALAPLPLGDVIVTGMMPPLLAGSPCFSQNSKQLNYDWKREKDGMLLGDIHCESQGFGLEWGIALTAGKRTDTVATVGPFFDNGAASPGFGAQAYVQLISFVGTSVTIDIQSATTSGGAYTTTGLTTAALSSPQAVRLTTASAISEFLKVITTGTFSSAVFAVQFSMNPVAVVF
jgi:hypothetical protein